MTNKTGNSAASSGNKSTAKAAPFSLLRKITVKNVIGGRPEKPDDGEYLALCHVYGLASVAKAEESDYGPYVRFVGQFEAVDLATGQYYRSNNVILPEPAQSMLESGIASAENGAQFALEIGVRGSEDSTTGYIYECSPLIEITQNDALVDMRRQMAALLPAPG